MLGVDDRVHLHRDAPVGPGLAADQLLQRRAQVRRRDDELAVLARHAVAGEVVEELAEVGAEVGIRRQHAEVFVRRRGLRVVVAGADVAVATDAVGLLPHDEQDLRVRLQADEPVDDVRARLLQHAGPFDVRLLVEARFQLDERDDLLARVGGLHERLHDAGFVAAGAVHRLLDREHRGIARGLLDERLDRGAERVVRVVQQHVAVAHRPEDVGLVARERGRRLRRELLVLELGPAQRVEVPEARRGRAGRRPRTRPAARARARGTAGRGRRASCAGRPRAAPRHRTWCAAAARTPSPRAGLRLRR